MFRRMTGSVLLVVGVVANACSNAPATCAHTSCSGACVDTTSNANHCGACGVLCSAQAPSTAACVSGECVVTLASAKDPAIAVAVDPLSVYWATEGSQGSGSTDGTIMKVPIAGGPTTTLAAAQGQPTSMAAQGSSVFWVDRFYGAIMKVNKAGGALVTLAHDDHDAIAIAVDTADVFWIGADGSRDGGVMKLDQDGGVPVQLCAASGVEVGVDPTGVIWVGGGALNRVAKDGGQATPLATISSPPVVHLAADSAKVYWTDAGTGSVMSVSVTGGVPVTIASGQQFPTAIAVDDTYVYWGSQGAIRKAPKAGGAAVTVTAAPYLNASALAVDATSVYWADGGQGAILKATPK